MSTFDMVLFLTFVLEELQTKFTLLLLIVTMNFFDMSSGHMNGAQDFSTMATHHSIFNEQNALILTT